MDLELKNAEGYDDPTAYEAIKNVTKKEKLKYIILRFINKKANKCEEVKRWTQMNLLKIRWK